MITPSEGFTSDSNAGPESSEYSEDKQSPAVPEIPREEKLEDPTSGGSSAAGKVQEGEVRGALRASLAHLQAKTQMEISNSLQDTGIIAWEIN